MADVALSALRSRVREAADMVGSSFVTDEATSLDAFINAGAQELYKLLVAKFEDYFEPTTQSLSLVAGTDSYALAADFYKLRGVDVRSGGDWYSVRPSLMSERNLRQAAPLTDLRCLRYRLQGGSLVFTPTPSVAGTARALYIPQFEAYDSADDADAREWWGWDEYVVQVAAAKCAVKEESDPSPFMAEAARLRRLIEEEADNRDASEPGSVGDAEVSAWEGYPWSLR